MKYIKIAVGFIFLISAEIIRELRSFRVTSYKITLGKTVSDETGFDKNSLREGISDRTVSGNQGRSAGEHRLVFLSDLHNQVYGRGNSRLLRAVRNAEPEVILAGGDMLVGKAGRSYEAAADFVRQMSSICPVYYANGNHEQRMKEMPECYGQDYFEYKAKLEEAGVHFLENDSAEIRLGRLPVRITGLEIPLSCYGRLGKGELNKKQVEERIGKRKPSVYEILLAHNPVYMKTYFKWGADLVLSGHFHGGIVRIPGITGIISPGFRIFPRYSGGIYKEGTQTAVVSKGLGSHTIPIRLFNPAEVVVLRACERDGNHV